MSHLATEGIAIILICDDAADVSAMADRILVFRGGRIVAELARGSFDQEAMLLAAAHVVRDNAAPAGGGSAMSEQLARPPPHDG